MQYVFWYIYYIIVEFAWKVENFQVHCTNYSYVLQLIGKSDTLHELMKGKKSGEEKGWLSSSDVKAHFRTKANET